MKRIMDFKSVENRHIHDLYSLMILRPASGEILPEILPGQFVQVSVDQSKTTFLRRPISVNYVDCVANELWLLIRKAGDGTKALAKLEPGNTVNLILPLGNGFTVPDKDGRYLLVGGGVGVAPLLQLGKVMKEAGIKPEFLLGARSERDLLEIENFRAIGTVHLSTDDGSVGVKGVVTVHPVMDNHFSMIYCCGPAPMMKAVAAKAASTGSECEVSLENMMACGLGACLCCVEKTVKGNVCVCTEGPVFNTKQLTW